VEKSSDSVLERISCRRSFANVRVWSSTTQNKHAKLLPLSSPVPFRFVKAGYPTHTQVCEHLARVAQIILMGAGQDVVVATIPTGQTIQVIKRSPKGVHSQLIIPNQKADSHYQ